MDFFDYEPDDFTEFICRLEAAGVTRAEFDITLYEGCTWRELNAFTEWAIARHNKKEAEADDTV